MRHRHNKQLPVSAPRPEHELHQRSLVQVATATTVSALAAADALAAVASVTAAGLRRLPAFAREQLVRRGRPNELLGRVLGGL